VTGSTSAPDPGSNEPDASRESGQKPKDPEPGLKARLRPGPAQGTGLQSGMAMAWLRQGLRASG